MRLLRCLAAGALLTLGCNASTAASNAFDGSSNEDGSDVQVMPDEDAGDAYDATSPSDAGISLNPPMGGGLVDALGDVGPFVDPLDGASGCARPVSFSGEGCSFAIPFRGAVTGVLEGTAAAQCGGNLSDASVSQLNFVSAGTNPATILFALSIVGFHPGAVGPTSALATLVIQPADGGLSSTWGTATESCIVTFASDACTASATSPSPYVMSGTVHCPQPAVASTGSSAAPVTIDDFWFVTSVQSH